MDNKQNSFKVHESAYVDEGASIGDGTSVWHFSHIMSGAAIGENCNIGQNVVVSPQCRVGNNVKIQNNVSVYTGVTLEDDVFCGPSMVFTNVINPRSHVSRKHEYKDTRVCKGASIGANATIVCGVTLGQYCFVGAGTVVTRDVPDFALVVGNPSRHIGYVCVCGVRLPIDSDGKLSDLSPANEDQCICAECQRSYRFTAGRLELQEKGD